MKKSLEQKRRGAETWIDRLFWKATADGVCTVRSGNRKRILDEDEGFISDGIFEFEIIGFRRR